MDPRYWAPPNVQTPWARRQLRVLKQPLEQRYVNHYQLMAGEGPVSRATRALDALSLETQVGSKVGLLLLQAVVMQVVD